MTITELKKAIQSKSIPSRMVWIDKNHVLTEYYIDNLSLALNRVVKKYFNPDEAISDSLFDLDKDNTIYLLYLNKKDISKTLSLMGEAIVIAITDDEEIKYSPSVLLGPLSDKASLVFLENYVKIEKKSGGRGRKKVDEDKVESEHHLSRELLEKALAYFDNNLDSVVNEINKVSVLGLQGSWDKPFKALLDCLPRKDVKLRSLAWFSGGDVDVCQVLYNVYIKKLRTMVDSQKKEQEVWARLVKESIWCEACIFSGLIGDYVSDYLKLVESSLPGDFKIQYFPPVFYKDLAEFPEYTKGLKAFEGVDEEQ